MLANNVVIDGHFESRPNSKVRHDVVLTHLFAKPMF